MRRFSPQTKIQILRSIKGFTLMEVMIVTAIIGLLSAIAVPNYLQWQSRYQLKEAAMEITSELMMSRFLAMNRNVAITTTFTISGGQLTTFATDPNGNPLITQVTRLPKVTNFVLVGGGNLQFGSSGLRASGTPGSDQLIQVTNDTGKVYSVRLTQGGKANWCPKDTCP
jgi:type IV fimbrial biogenesis protein FimT